MADYVKFINSKTIRDFYRKHQILLDDQSPKCLLKLIVYSVYTTWEEKIEALKELKNYSQSHEKMELIFGNLSLCDVIELYCRWEERTYNHFYRSDEKSFYEYNAEGSNGIRIGSVRFKSVEDALSNFFNISGFSLNSDIDWHIWIDRINIENRISVLIRNPLDVYSPANIREDEFSIVNKIAELPNIVFEHPFLRGDILEYKDPVDSRNDKIFVFDHFEECFDPGQLFGRTCVYGYFVTWEHDLEYDNAIGCESYDNLEYFHGELQGYDRYLRFVSRMIKGESSSGDKLMLSKIVKDTEI